MADMKGAPGGMWPSLGCLAAFERAISPSSPRLYYLLTFNESMVQLSAVALLCISETK
jgi:hypothetical protein